MREILRRTAFAAVAGAVFAAWAAPVGAAEKDVRREVVRALAVKDPKERILQVEAVLRGADSAAAADAIVEVVFDAETPQAVLDVAMPALAKMTSRDAGEALARSAEKQSRFRRVLLAEALGRGQVDESQLLLRTLARAPDARVRAAALTGLGDRRDPGCITALEPALADPEWTVRSAAIRGLRVLGGKDVVPLLEGRRASETGRLLDDLADALRDVRESLPQDQRASKAPAFTPPPPSFRSPLLDTRSRRLLFVLSTAETMRDPVAAADADEQVAAGVAAAGKDLAADLAAAKTKLDVARVHLRTMLRTLADGVEFDVMIYAGSPDFAFGELVAADDASRRKAESRVARLSAGGAPNVHEALHRIFDPRGKDVLDAPDGPDTVVVFSDGALPSNLFNDKAEIAPRAARWNRARQIRFVTISVGQAEQYLLGTLAGGPPPGRALSIP